MLLKPKNIKAFTKAVTAFTMTAFLCMSCSIKLMNPSSERYLAGPAIRDYQPENIVEEVQYPCSVTGPTQRRMIVYLPKDYYESDKQYPVFYLLHGARGYETSWIRFGEVYQSTDSLWKHSLAEQCIIVMPNVNQYYDDKDYDGGRFKGAYESIWEVDGKAEWSFISDVVNLTDSLYRTIPERQYRAVGGLSIGGIQSIYFGANYPEVFGNIIAMSPYFWTSGKHHAYYHAFYDNLKPKMAVQFRDYPPETYFLFAGKWDLARPSTLKLHRYMERKGYPHVYKKYPGSHDWPNGWIEEYKDVLPLLFRNEEN